MLLFFLELNVPPKFTTESIFKFIDFKSSIPSDTWSFLIQTAKYLIELSPELKGPLCAHFTKYLPVIDLDLIIKFYEISWIGHQGEARIHLDDLKKYKKDLIFKFIGSNPERVLKLIKILKKDSNVYLRYSVIYEFLNTEESNKTAFLVQLACSSIISPIPDASEFFTLELRKTIKLARKSAWTQLYRNLFLLTDLSLLPDDVNELSDFLCDTCNLERINFDFPNRNRQVLELCDPLRITVIKSHFVLSSGITPFNCLSQLLKLLFNVSCISREVFEYISLVKKKKEYNMDEYFNLLFIE